MLGYAAPAGDFNLDGLQDMACGAPGADRDGLIDNGIVYVVFLRPDFTTSRRFGGTCKSSICSSGTTRVLRSTARTTTTASARPRPPSATSTRTASLTWPLPRNMRAVTALAVPSRASSASSSAVSHLSGVNKFTVDQVGGPTVAGRSDLRSPGRRSCWCGHQQRRRLQCRRHRRSGHRGSGRDPDDQRPASQGRGLPALRRAASGRQDHQSLPGWPGRLEPCRAWCL